MTESGSGSLALVSPSSSGPYSTRTGLRRTISDVNVLDPIECKVAKQLQAINIQLLLSGIIFVNPGPNSGLVVSVDRDKIFFFLAPG